MAIATSSAPTASLDPRLEPGWKAALADQFAQPYMAQLKSFLVAQKRAGKRVFPPGPQIFNAFDLTPFDAVRVVIVGQDPYHGPGQAHGLCFSVARGVDMPPSLINIFKELGQDLNVPMPAHGNLEHWAQQGVLLLNATLTVEAHCAASHQGRGWERFTDAAIAALNEQRDGLVFVLWGASARRKGEIVDRSRHLVLTSPHPSPLSAHKGFFGCGHFSRINRHLQSRGEPPIDWSLPV